MFVLQEQMESTVKILEKRYKILIQICILYPRFKIDYYKIRALVGEN
ncbi:MAG: hypothetical protein JWQ40_3986 [Segetibacter sp.]|nr:hypothetical protein [Segetibacter sp.]